MSWLYYILEANLYLVLFYGFYRLFLQHETFYNLNRYFLLCATVISFALPVLQIGLLKPSIDQLHGDYLLYTGAMPPPPMERIDTVNAKPRITDINWMYIMYLLIAFGFALKLSFGIYKIIKIWIKAKKHTAGDITLIEINGESTAFSFFNLLFIHPSLANQPAVLKHEMVHIKQKHSFDVVFFELVQIICWFNPILHFLKKDIKLLHEYIADELTTNADVHKHEYALFLIQNSFGLRAQPITNQIFNQSILKRRINMLNKKRTAGWARLRLLLAVPLAGAMLCTSTMAFTKDYGYVDLLPEKSEFTTSIQVNPKVDTLRKNKAPQKKEQVKFPPPVVKRDQVKFPPTFKPKTQDAYVVRYTHDQKTGEHIRLDKRYAVINGKPVVDQEKFYGVTNAESVTILNSEEASKRYGNNGKNGAVEITGSSSMKYIDELVIPPPPKVETIHFAPPSGTFNYTYFTPNFRKDKATGKVVVFDKRYIVVNGKPIENNSAFYGVTKSESVTFLNQAQATKVYGAEKGKYGAVEIKGSNVSYNKEDDQIKFPPPLVKPDSPRPVKSFKTPPPPVEPIGARQKIKKAAPPPPPVEPDPKIINIKLKEEKPSRPKKKPQLAESSATEPKIINIKLKAEQPSPPKEKPQLLEVEIKKIDQDATNEKIKAAIKAQIEEQREALVKKQYKGY